MASMRAERNAVCAVKRLRQGSLESIRLCIALPRDWIWGRLLDYSVVISLIVIGLLGVFIPPCNPWQDLAGPIQADAVTAQREVRSLACASYKAVRSASSSTGW